MESKDIITDERIVVPDFKGSNGFFTSKERSRQMSKIRRKDTKPERMFRKALHGKGIRYRVDFSGLPGRPDISNISKNFVVFIDGEFWHGYNWEEKKRKLKSNRGFWIPKIERNMQKDYEVNMALENLGFKVFRFWDHQIKKDLDKCVQEVVKFISNS